MLSIHTERLFRDVLVEIFEGEICSENLRQQLCGGLPDFSPYSAFMRIDRTAEENLNGGNILQFLRDNNVFQFTQNDCQRLINFYDSERSGFLNYQDFLQMVLPCEDVNLRVETCNRQFFRVSRHEQLPREMEVAVINVIQQELRVFKELEKLTYDLERRPDYTPLSVYRCIDRQNDGKIDKINLDQFFRSNGLFLSDKEFYALIRRMDTSGDQSVSFQELKDFFENQVGFRSEQTVISMTKATPEVRKYMHNAKQTKQIKSVTKPQKIYGHEANPMYHWSPERLQSQVLEERVFVEESPRRKKKRNLTATKKQRPQSAAYYGKSDYSDPMQRPNLLTKSKSKVISTKLPSSSKALQRALQSTGKQSQFMKKMNKPLLMNQVKEELLDAFLQLIDQERLIESSKIQLVMHSDFNLFDSFKIFDDMGRGSLTLPELYNGIVNKLGIVPSQDEIELFFHRYDKDRDGRLRFTEYCDAFVPLEPHYAEMINCRHSINRSSVFSGARPEHMFVPLTVMDLKEVWRTHFRVEVLAEDLRQKLSLNPLFNLENAFEVCDLNNSGEVTHNEIRRVVESRGLFVSDKEARSLMQKFDKGKRGTITKMEFLQELVPRSPIKNKRY